MQKPAIRFGKRVRREVELEEFRIRREKAKDVQFFQRPEGKFRHPPPWW